jgi:hypothetical protein
VHTCPTCDLERFALWQVEESSALARAHNVKHDSPATGRFTLGDPIGIARILAHILFFPVLYRLTRRNRFAGLNPFQFRVHPSTPEEKQRCACDGGRALPKEMNVQAKSP